MANQPSTKHTHNTPESKSIDYKTNDMEYKSTDYASNATESLLHFGYKVDKYLSVTMQGQLYVALDQNNNDEPMIIKKIPSVNIDKFHFIKSKLFNSSQYNKASSEIITLAKCMDLFQSETHCYLVFDYDFNVDLKTFVIKSHEYIAEGKLSLRKYKKTIKFLMWRLIKTIHTLHKYHKPCDLDLNHTNVMIHSGDFIECDDGTVTINPNIDIRLLHFENFGEVSNLQNLKNGKEWSVFVPPNGKYSNVWCYGMIVYFCLLGDFPSEELYYLLANNRCIENHLGMFALLRFVTSNSISLLNGVFGSTSHKGRFEINDILKQKWFREYSK